MIPCLYDQSETAFTSNGIGKLTDCISCIVTEERNGTYELSMEYPVDGIHGSDLIENAIIYAQPAYGKAPQPFRIYKITTPIDGRLEIDARHVSYQLNYITVSPTTVVSTLDQQPTEAFKALKENASVECPFSFETDISSTAYFGILEPMSFRCALGGVDGSMLDTFGGEYEWDNYTVRLLKARGSDNGVRIVYGKNLVDFTQEKDIEEVITGVHPYWRDSETGDITELPEKVVSLSSYDSPYEKIGLLDCSTQFEEEPTWDQMRSYAQNYLNDTNLTEPNIDIDIDFAQLWQTPGYEDIVEAEQVSLCDTVHVYITKLGIEVSTKVTETEYDVLAEKYTSITLSNSPTSARNSSFALTVATTSQVRTMIAMTDNSIRLSVSKTYVTRDKLENDYSTTVEIRDWIELTEEAITLAYTEKLRDEYSTTEEITSMIELSEEGIMLEFDKYSTTSEVQSMIKVSEDGIALTYVKNGNVRSQFALEDDRITIDSGTVTFNTGRLIVNGDNFSLTSNGVLTTASGNYKETLNSGAFSIYYGDVEMGRLRSSFWESDSSKRGFTINVVNADYSGFAINGTLGFIYNNSLNPDGHTERNLFFDAARFAGWLYLDNPMYIGDAVQIYYGTYNQTSALWDYTGFYADGDIGCGGTKYRVVNTEHYGNIGMNAFETASAMFGDTGSGKVGEDGQISVFFAPEFMEVIDMDADYQVFLTSTSELKTEWVEKEYDHFIVHGEHGATFDWMVSAHQRDYTMNRLEAVTLEAEPDVEFDESIFNTDNAANEILDEMLEQYEREIAL